MRRPATPGGLSLDSCGRILSAMRPQPALAIALLLAACDSARVETSRAPSDPDVEALVTAEPQEWLARGDALLAKGARVAPALVASLRANPAAPGAQPAIAALGALGDPVATEYLREVLAADGPHAYEAALALGRLPAPAALPDLERTLAEKGRSPLVRTACAAALLDLGRRGAAIPFFYALFTVDTSAAGPEVAQAGLASKPRWALERNIAISALRRAGTADAFGLDADAPWPRLAEAARKMREHYAGATR